MIRRFADSQFYYPWRGLQETPRDLGFRFEDFDFESEGLRLHGWWIPAQGSGEAIGTVVHAHGNAANLSNHLYASAFLARMGFNLLLFDWRGFGLSEGRPSRAGLQADLRAALDAVHRRPEVGPEGRVALYAQSIGAVHALVAAPGRRDLVCVVAEAPFTSHRAIARRALALPGLAHVISWWAVAPGLDPIDSVAALPCPVLFIHGRSDRLIPARMTQRLFDLAPAPKEIRWIEGYGHLNGTAAAEEELHRVVIGYLKSCFEADAQRRLD